MYIPYVSSPKFNLHSIVHIFQIRVDNNLCLSETLPRLQKKCAKMQEIFEKVDKLEVILYDQKYERGREREKRERDYLFLSHRYINILR